MNAAQVMQAPAATVRLDETWRDALRALLGAELNAIAVVDSDGCIVGIVTQTDLATRVQGPEREAMREMLDGVLAPRPPRPMLRWHQPPKWEHYARVETVMTTPAVTVTPETPLTVVARLLLAHEIDQIPVVDALRRPLGVVRQRDLVAALATGVPLPDTVIFPPEQDAFAAWAYS